MIVKYFSEDGREFSTPEDCRSYEAMLKTVSEQPNKKFTDLVHLVNESGEQEIWYSIKNPLDLYYFENLDKVTPHNVEDVIYQCLIFCKSISTFPFYIKRNSNGKIISLNKMLASRIEYMNQLKLKLETVVNYVEQITNILNPEPLVEEETNIEPPQDAHTSVLTNDLPKDDSDIEEKKKTPYKGKKSKELTNGKL